MSLNDFENVSAVDEDAQIISKLGGSVRAAMVAKQGLEYAIAEAIDTSTNFGYELGAEDMKLKIIQAFEDSDGACSAWALGVIDSVVG
jgi:hypothetical protein